MAGVDLFLDSGAYSAKTQGVTIDIQEYIQFIKEHKRSLGVYANLDVIGNAEGTWENQKIMEQAGLRPLPVFHRGEDPKYLKEYLKKYDYIALGGLVGAPASTMEAWLTRIFTEYLCDPNGWPIVKVHGFGLTSLSMLMRYPWYSVDSTAWVITGRMGSIFVPRYRSGKWIYDENSWKIAVSNRSPSKKDAGAHFDTLTIGERKVIKNYLDEKGYRIGKSSFSCFPQSYQLQENERWAEKKPKDKNKQRLVETIEEVGLSNTYQLRDELNCIYFLDLEKNLPEWPWQFKMRAKGLLGL